MHDPRRPACARQRSGVIGSDIANFAPNGLNSSKNLSELLKKHGIKHELRLSEGGHTWINWRHYLNDFAPQLFQ